MLKVTRRLMAPELRATALLEESLVEALVRVLARAQEELLVSSLLNSEE